jgi:hypothetical protein
LDNVTADVALIGGLSGCQHVPQNPHNPQNLVRRPVLRVVRVLRCELVGRWLRLGLVRPDIRQGTHEVVGGVLHWPWRQKFDGSELLVRGIKGLGVPALALLGLHKVEA